MSQLIQKLKERFSLPEGEEKKVRLILAAGVVGIVLILFSDFLSPSAEQSAALESDAAAPISNEDYVQSLESRLEALLEEVEGVRNVQVMVTLEQGAQAVYASEGRQEEDRSEDFQEGETARLQTKSSTENSYILTEGQSGKKQPVVSTVMEPRIKGVAVVCTGGGNSVIQARIVEILTTVLGVGSHQICVSPRG